MKKLLLSIVLAFLCIQAFAQDKNPLIVKNDFQNQKKWVDSIYDKMTLEEKMGQLFMADIFSSDPKAKTDKIKDLITNYHLGGVIFSKGGPVRQAKLNNEFQSLAKVPLMVGMDAEWGLAMRLDSTYAFPWNMTLGAITDNKIVEKVGKRIGEHAKRLGVHINFAPVVDININQKKSHNRKPVFWGGQRKCNPKSACFYERNAKRRNFGKRQTFSWPWRYRYR